MEMMPLKVIRWVPGFLSNKLNMMVYNFMVLLFLCLSGCSALTAVPLTLNEVKAYVVGQQESFFYPLNQVLVATVYGLRKSGFTRLRVEHFNQKCSIYAKWAETSVKLTLETVTPKLTKVSSKIHGGRGFRDYSCESALFDEVREILQTEQPLNWKKLTMGMVTVHVSPDENSPVIAYLGSGSEAELIEEQGHWGKVALIDSAAGFVALKYLNPAPEQEAH